ncbi:MAG: YegS/Rv2252/BmrU family lipid kinase [Jatrophihabitantaceae bacterium]
MSEPRRFTALVNPISGGGRAAQKWAPLAARISASGADVRVELTRSREHAIEAATAAAAAGDVVVAVGGDGLVRDIAGGVVAAAATNPTATMAIVPAGRGNDLARALRLPTDLDALLQMMLNGPARPIDVIDVAGVIVPGNVYAGIDSVANALINSNRWIPGLLLYRLAPIRAIATWHAPTYTITADGQTRTVRAHTVIIANSGGYGHGLQIVPGAIVDDGLLDVMVVGHGPRRAVASFMRQAKTGRHIQRPEVTLMTAREVTISADRPLPFCGDGDELGQLPKTVTIRPGALNLIAP